MVNSLSGGYIGRHRFGRTRQVPVCRAGRPRGGGRENHCDTQRTRRRLPRSASGAAADQIWGAQRCVPVRGFDHSGRADPGFRAGQVIAALLADTHLVLWARIAPERLTTGERRALDDARSCYVSAVSLWEIAILMALDRIARDQRDRKSTRL